MEKQEISSIEFHPDGLMLIVGLKDGTIKILDIRSNQVIYELADYKGELSNISSSRKGLHFAASWKNQNVCRIFNLKKLGKEDYQIEHSLPVNNVCFDNYGSYLLTSAGNTVNVYSGKHWNDAALKYNQPVYESGVVNVAKFSKSGRMIVAGGSDDKFMKVFGL